MKKVVIDARLSGLEHAGIGRYTQALVEGLKSQISNLKSQIFEIKIIKPDIRHYTIQEQMKIPKIIEQEHPDLVHFPHFNVPLLYNKPFVVTIHDLLWHEQVGMNATTLPSWLYGVKYLGYRMVMNHAINDAKAIIVPSKWVSKKIIDRFPSVKDKIHVIYEGVSEKFMKGHSGGSVATDRISKVKMERDPIASLQDDNNLLKRYGLKKNQYLIYTGSLYPHKNVSIALDILPKFPHLKLVVACARSVFWRRFERDVEKRGLRKKVVLAGFVPDEELAALYRHALAFVFPSLSEGFGLPGLEAMAAGCPVIASNAGALSEIYGDSSTDSGQAAALYFDPKSDRDLRREIERIQNEKGLREELIRKGRARVAQFSWDKCAKETFELYKRVCDTVRL